MINISEEIAATVVQIIDQAAAKGMFSGKDLSVVGTIRSTIVDAIQTAVPADDYVDAKTKASEK